MFLLDEMCHCELSFGVNLTYIGGRWAYNGSGGEQSGGDTRGGGGTTYSVGGEAKDVYVALPHWLHSSAH